MSRTDDFYSLARVSAKKIWDGHNELKALEAEGVYLDYANTFPASGTGENDGITRDELVSVVSTTNAALKALFDAGHGANLMKLL
jgi:hypothetical protein